MTPLRCNEALGRFRGGHGTKVFVIADSGPRSRHCPRAESGARTPYRRARPAIPPRVHEAPVVCPEPIYNNRNRVERLKEWRAVATRCEKTAASFLGVLCLAATADWLRR
jgi:transposase